MKKIYKNIIKTVFALLILLVVGCSSEMITDPMASEAVAKNYYRRLLDELEKSFEASIYDNGLDLNKYYGGAYLNEDKKLTICCTTDDNQIADLFREAAGSSDVIIKHVKFTYDELNTLKEEFHELVKVYMFDKELNEKNRQLIDDLSGWCVDVQTNRLELGIDKLDSDKEELFYELFDIFPIDSVRFENRGKPIPLTGEE